MRFSWPCPVCRRLYQRVARLVEETGALFGVGGVWRYLEVEHAGLVGGLDGRVLGTLLEQSVEL